MLMVHNSSQNTGDEIFYFFVCVWADYRHITSRLLEIFPKETDTVQAQTSN